MPELKEKNGEHPYGDAGQLVLLAFFLFIWGADSFWMRKTTWLAGYIPLYIRLVLMGLGLAVAIYFSMSGHVVVSRHRRPQGVVTTGAFRYLRHPLYAASLKFYGSLVVSTMSLVSLVLVVGIFVFYNYIAGYEEKLLEKKFGSEYRRYKGKVGKWGLV